MLRFTRQGGLLLAVGLATATVAAAQSPPEPQFQAELDYGRISLEGRALDYAFVDPVGGLSGGGAIKRLNLDDELTPRFRVGWRIPGNTGAWLDARFWTWDGGGSATTGTRPNRIGALLASPDFAIGRSLVDRADSRAIQRATSYSLLLRWPITSGAHGPRFDAAAGLRGVRFEEERLTSYHANRSNVVLFEAVSNKQDVRAWGPAVEGRLSGSFGSRLTIGGSAEAAFLLGRIDFNATDQSIVDGSADRATIATREDERRDLTLFGGSLWLEVRLSRVVTIGAVYRFERWDGVADGARFVDDVSQNSAIVADGRATFTGPSIDLRLSW